VALDQDRDFWTEIRTQNRGQVPRVGEGDQGQRPLTVDRDCDIGLGTWTENWGLGSGTGSKKWSRGSRSGTRDRDGRTTTGTGAVIRMTGALGRGPIGPATKNWGSNMWGSRPQFWDWHLKSGNQDREMRSGDR